MPTHADKSVFSSLDKLWTCGREEERVEVLEKDNTVLRSDNVSLRAGLKNVEDELKTAMGDQDMVTLRELCYSVEEQVCREAFGFCALEEYRYRFKHIKDNAWDRKQVAEIWSTFQFEGMSLESISALQQVSPRIDHRIAGY
jgi:hypothetical protein